MNDLERLSDGLTGASSQIWRAKRMAVGWGVAGGLLLAIVGYILTHSGWWFFSPLAGFAVAWRVVVGRWPFARRRE